MLKNKLEYSESVHIAAFTATAYHACTHWECRPNSDRCDKKTKHKFIVQNNQQHWKSVVWYATRSSCGTALSSSLFLRSTTGTAIARLAQRNSVCLSVCPSVCHTGGSVKNGASYRITKSLPSAAWKTLVLGSVKLFHKFEKGPRARALNERG